MWIPHDYMLISSPISLIINIEFVIQHLQTDLWVNQKRIDNKYIPAFKLTINQQIVF